MPTIETNGSTFDYVERGTGTPVVLVHGSISDRRGWDGQLEALSDRHRVIAYSRRYHHPNPWIGDGSDYTVSRHAEDLASLIEALQLGPDHLVGSSYGAYAALVAAIRHPESARTLVLGEPPIVPLLIRDPSNPADLLWLFVRRPRTAMVVLRFMLRAIKPTQDALRRGDMEDAVRRFSDGVLGEGGYDQPPEADRTKIGDNAPALGAELLGEGFEPFPIDEACALTKPVLLLDGGSAPNSSA